MQNEIILVVRSLGIFRRSIQMGKQNTRYQLFEYPNEDPCIIYNMNIAEEGIVSSHWHKELELVYYLRGHTLHYIDGQCYHGFPGRVIVTNTECVHNILPDGPTAEDGKPDCVVILIREEFLNRYFPGSRNVHFTNEKEQADRQLSDTIMKLSAYADAPKHESQEFLYLNGLLLHLLYYLYNEGVQSKEDASVLRSHKNADQLKDVLQYIAEHYTEALSQKQLAEKFYFDPSHLSRLFKKCMGVTFTDYLTRYRLSKARKELLESDASIMDIALGNGFSDSRSFINAFKKYYGRPPFQYRKEIRHLP